VHRRAYGKGEREMIIYLDLLFLVNFVIDGAVLLTTARVRKIDAPLWRIAASAAIGAFYVVLMLLPPLSFLFTFAVKILFSLIMILAAFGFGSLQHLLVNLGVFYLVNFAAAGGIIGVHYLLQSSRGILGGIAFTGAGGPLFEWRIGLVFVLAVIGPMLLLYRYLFRSAERRERMLDFLAQVTIRIGDFELHCVGLIDTGNRLYDPLTRTPVMVVEAGLWEPMLPESWMRMIRSSEVEKLVSDMGADAEFAWRDRLRLVPYRGVNRGTQFMLAIKPDRVVIVHNEQTVEADKVLVGMDGGRLCADGSYRAIIHPNLMHA